MFHLEFTPSRLIIGIAVILTVFLVVWILRSLRNTYYSKTTRTFLAILRILSVIILIVMLTDMRILSKRDKLLPAHIAILWDRSESMRLADSSYSPRKIIISPEYKRLQKRVSISHISNMEKPVIVTESRIKQLPINERISDNGELLNFADKQTMFDELILVSDGNSYLGESLEDILLKNKLKVHALAVGNVMGPAVPELRSINYPTYLNDSDSIRLDWSLYNKNKQETAINLSISLDDKIIFRSAEQLPGERMISLSEVLPPQPAGSHQLVFSIGKKEDEQIIGSEMILVHSSRSNVLYYSEPPDKDVAMMASILKDDPRYDVFEKNEWDKVQDKKPDLVIQTWGSDRERLYQDVPSIFIYRDDKNSYQDESELVVNDQKPYVRYTGDISRDARYWTQVPPIQVARFTSQARHILSGGRGRPVIIEGHLPKSICVNAAGIWRWNIAGYQKEWDGIYKHLVTGMAEALIRQSDKSYISFDRPYYYELEYEDIPIKLKRYDIVNSEMDAGEEIIRVTDSSFSEIRRINPEQDGSAEVSFDKEGRYYFIVDLFSEGTLLESDTAGVIIEANDMEKQFRGCNEKALKKLAKHHHGQYIRYDELNKLPEMIGDEKTWRVQEKDLCGEKDLPAVSCHVHINVC